MSSQNGSNDHASLRLRTNQIKTPSGEYFQTRDRSGSIISSTSSSGARLVLDFLIVGAGVAGLAAAIELRRSGHFVNVFEKAPGLGQHSGGIHLPPNLSKLLVEWGLEQDMVAFGLKSGGMSFTDMKDGKHLGLLGWTRDVIRESGGEFYLADYDDLHRLLYEHAVSLGAAIQFDSEIETVVQPSEDEPNSAPQVVLKNGQIIKGDVIVAADGSTSQIRPIVLDDMGRDARAKASGGSVLTTTISMDKMRECPELAELTKVNDRPTSVVWIGEYRMFQGYPVQKGKAYALLLFCPDTDCKVQAVESWDNVVSVSDLDLTPYEPRVRKLLELAKEMVRYQAVERGKISDWVDYSGRIVLTGEAAHPPTPGNIHNAALAVEDGVVLGMLFRRVRALDQIPSLLDAFQELRQGRTYAVQQLEKAWMEDTQNASMRAVEAQQKKPARSGGGGGSVSSDDADSAEQWEQVGEFFAYHAREAADDWFTKWGALHDRNTAEGPGDVDDLNSPNTVTTFDFAAAFANASSVVEVSS